MKRKFPNRVNYYFFSEKLKKNHLKSRRRKAKRLLAEAVSIQNSLDREKKLPKRFRINNPLVDVRYDYQTNLVGMDEEEALRLLLEDVIDGREGCFCLTSNLDMPAPEALRIYRSKDAIESSSNRSRARSRSNRCGYGRRTPFSASSSSASSRS